MMISLTDVPSHNGLESYSMVYVSSTPLYKREENMDLWDGIFLMNSMKVI